MMWKFNDYKDRIAALDDCGDKITYRELSDFSKELSVFGRKLTFNICENSIGSLAGYTAMINAGVVPVMLANDLDKELRQRLLDTYQPDYIWLPERMIENFPRWKIIISKYRYVLLKTDYECDVELYKDLALLLTTSGSTGSPKLVRQSYENIKANTESIVQYLELDETERPITTLPMNYTYGISIINTHLYVGATLLLTNKTLMQKEFWNFFKSEQATSFGGVPYTYEMLKKLRFFQMELPFLRTMTQAGGKLTPELHKQFAEYAVETGKKFIVMYGQTEATARMSYLPSERSLEKYGSMGIAIPGGRFSLIDINGKVINENGIVGELVYEGKNVTLGYAERRDDLTKKDERGGKLITGDMAKRDDDGYYYIVGRKKRFLKMFGNRVNLDEIDRLIKTKYEGIDCASTGVDDKMYVFITDKNLTEEVKAYIAEKIHINVSALKACYLEKIPKNDSGKTLYTELEKYYV
jgi:acyl-coenzyme A synthetase/AMP-(fatty) acid ligase